MSRLDPDPLDREVLLAFWKVHILHHASKGPVYGLWLVQELAEHGYRLNPGTLYPVLERMERNGWLQSERAREDHIRSRRSYTITAEGSVVLDRLRGFMEELHHEIFEEDEKARRGPKRRAPARTAPKKARTAARSRA
jgi:DNA-binding PadR family transcriptional regulator